VAPWKWTEKIDGWQQCLILLHKLYLVIIKQVTLE